VRNSDDELIKWFLGVTEVRRRMAKVLRKAGFSIVRVEVMSREIWCLHLKPDRGLRDLLATSRQILFWVAEHDELQVDHIINASRYIIEKRPLFSEILAIIASRDSGTRRMVEEVGEKLQTPFAGFSIKEFSGFLPFGQTDFLRALQTQFFTRDLYRRSLAITSPASFFGRKSIVNELLAHLRQGTAHVGLFGLRKMGKTSVLYRLLDSLRTSGVALTAHIDVQLIDAINPTASYFLRSVGDQLLDANPSARQIEGLKLFGREGSPHRAISENEVFELFAHDLKAVLAETRTKVIILFDEIERMSPEASRSKWGDSFIRIWRLLRGLDQTYPDRLGFFVTGTNPQCIEANTFAGQENPVYNYFSRYYLSPLDQAECEELLTKLGTRMGLAWRPEVIESLSHQVGGHPFLLRSFASIIHRELSPRTTEVWVEPHLIPRLVDRFLLQHDSDLSQMVDVLRDQYNDEFWLLGILADGRVGEFRELVRSFPNEIGHLIGYGLIGKDLDNSGLQLEVLQTWLQRRRDRERTSIKIGESEQHPKGSQIGKYKVLSSVGNAGGFACVYKAEDADGETVALKVLHEGSLAALEREIDVLANIDHQNIVKVLDYGSASNDGPLYLAMEFLEGRTLRAFCERSQRLPTNQLRTVLYQLLDALIHVHPDDERIEQLRRRQELDASDLAELNRARHGYVHRDIKPENIILHDLRGPVLIDFNISVKVLDPIRTQSGTPGYLPPDGLDGRWTPDVDLFQLGLTCLQVATGYPYDSTSNNLEDLREIARTEVPEPLRRVLLRLTEASRSERYASARAAQRDLRGSGM